MSASRPFQLHLLCSTLNVHDCVKNCQQEAEAEAELLVAGWADIYIMVGLEMWVVAKLEAFIAGTRLGGRAGDVIKYSDRVEGIKNRAGDGW
ncbi:hypothetical protein Pmani_001106 [Petrolisthes manimaculis]|uniref:Uncharacterized protein n=1 Tax=Petrolisthes manimaculis TaxID=1843537 RepID=A0AAE1QNI4_9EUCA|nr:hypothetical protein Pmani_001106 [Petrolisthes manimaculis]